MLGFFGHIDIATSIFFPRGALKSCRPFKRSLILKGKCACFAGVKKLMRIKTAEHLYQFCNHARPTGLMASAESGAIIAMEVFVEENVILPVRVGLELLGASIY